MAYRHFGFKNVQRATQRAHLWGDFRRMIPWGIAIGLALGLLLVLLK